MEKLQNWQKYVILILVFIGKYGGNGKKAKLDASIDRMKKDI